ncbi:uncharacterized protein LOC114749353 isoform X2 [Neltuma alba]|uniref:uncharacterized protein LOC114749353 isoform X2 n=1 Tax=Neltuma alba TaxID=207710 RepID=UPI0010A33EA0|nr:uncharacterized protein LOC114749353 isoform X2 [Prosopis alba]
MAYINCNSLGAPIGPTMPKTRTHKRVFLTAFAAKSGDIQKMPNLWRPRCHRVPRMERERIGRMVIYLSDGNVMTAKDLG